MPTLNESKLIDKLPTLDKRIDKQNAEIAITLTREQLKADTADAIQYVAKTIYMVTPEKGPIVQKVEARKGVEQIGKLSQNTING